MSDEPVLVIDGTLDLRTRRAAAERLVDLATAPQGVDTSSKMIGGIRCLVCTPAHGSRGTIVHTHGGHSMCSVDSHRRLAGHLARRSSCTVVLVGYRRADPSVSPLFGELTGLPPLLIQAAADEVLLDDAHRLAACAEAAGIRVELEVADGMQYAWHLAAGNDCDDPASSTYRMYFDVDGNDLVSYVESGLADFLPTIEGCA